MLSRLGPSSPIALWITRRSVISPMPVHLIELALRASAWSRACAARFSTGVPLRVRMRKPYLYHETGAL